MALRLVESAALSLLKAGSSEQKPKHRNARSGLVVPGQGRRMVTHRGQRDTDRVMDADVLGAKKLGSVLTLAL